MQSNQNGPLPGALLYTFITGTTATPQFAFQDIGLTQQLPWPIPADLNGRLPMFYLPAGNVHARLTDSSGNVQFDYPNVLVIGGASSGGGGGGTTVDPTTVASTGDIKWRLTNENLAGWVTLNGQTIGSATSGATGFASATAQALFIYLWTFCNNAHCPVTPSGRGATALVDFAAGKQLQLPDMRDATPVGRDCMGNSCLGGILLSNITSGGTDTADTAGAFGGRANQPILLANLPNLSLPVTAVTMPAISASVSSGTVGGAAAGTVFNGTGSAVSVPINAAGIAVTVPINGSGTGTASLAGSGTALPILSPFKLSTWYMKL